MTMTMTMTMMMTMTMTMTMMMTMTMTTTMTMMTNQITLLALYFQLRVATMKALIKTRWSPNQNAQVRNVRLLTAANYQLHRGNPVAHTVELRNLILMTQAAVP